MGGILDQTGDALGQVGGLLGQGGGLPSMGDFSSGLLGDPLLNVGVGLLASSGPSLTPISTGQGLAEGIKMARTAEQQNLRNQATRAGIEDAARKRRAQEQLGGLLGGQGEQGELLGLLAQVAPGATAQGLLGQAFPRQSSLERNLRALKIDPNTLTREEKMAFIGGGDGGMEALIKRLRAEQIAGDISKSKSEAEEKAADVELSTIGSIDNLTKLADIIPRMQAGRLLTDPRGIFADGQTFNALAQSEAIDSSLRTLGKQGGVSATELNAVIGTKPAITNLPEVNAGIVADKLEAIKRFGKRAKVPIGDVSRLDATIKKMREFAASRSKTQPRTFTPGTPLPPEAQRRNGDLSVTPRGTFKWDSQSRSWLEVE